MILEVESHNHLRSGVYMGSLAEKVIRKIECRHKRKAGHGRCVIWTADLSCEVECCTRSLPLVIRIRFLIEQGDWLAISGRVASGDGEMAYFEGRMAYIDRTE